MNPLMQQAFLHVILIFARVVTLRRSLLFALFCAASAGAADDLPIHRLPLEGALVQNTVVTMLQDRKGLMWFGTLGGLDVYDGYDFRTISSDPRSNNALSGIHVSRLHEDTRGNLWVAGFRGWLNRIEPGTEVIHEYPRALYVDDSAGPISGPTAFHDMADGTLLLGTATGLYRYQHDTDRFEPVATALEDGPLPPVRDIETAVDGRLWLATTEGLVLFDPLTGERQYLQRDPDDPNPLPAIGVLRLLVDDRGRLWLGSLSEGLARLDPATGQVRLFRADPADPGSLGSDIVYDLMQDAQGRIWVANQSGGLSLFLSDEQGFAVYRHEPNDPRSISGNDVWSLYQDRSGLIWIGTAGQGLNQLNPIRNRFDTLQTIPFDDNSLASDFVWDLGEAEDGTVWMATLAGLERYDPETGRAMLFEPAPGRVSANQLQSLAIDDTGHIWLGAVDGSLYRFDPRDSVFREHFRPDGPLDAFDSGRIWTLLATPDSRLWVGGTSAIFALDTDSGRIVETLSASEKLPLGANPVRVLTRGPDGSLWAGGGGPGLFRILPGHGLGLTFSPDPNNPASLSHAVVRSLHFDADGGLWIGTLNGLNHISREDLTSGHDRFRVYTTRDGLPNNTIYGILPGSDGELWLSTNRGLSRFTPDSERFHNFDVSDGLPSNEMNGGAELRSSTGQLYFGGVRGVAIVSPEDIPYNRSVPGVTITRFSLDARRVPLAPGRGPDRITVPYGSNDTSVEFAVTDYHQPEKNRFRYRLIGASEKWQASSEPRVVFNNLGPGAYRFQVQGAHSDGVWSERNAYLAFQIQPPWWRSSWAWFIYGLALLTALAAYHRTLRRKLARERALSDELTRAHSLAEANHRMSLHHARTDQLTQLPNRTTLLDTLARRMRERGAGLAVMLVNLDRFQRINDSLGHGIGDEMLKHIAERLQSFISDDDFLARIGSDEFAWLTTVENDRPLEDWAVERALALNQVLSMPFEFSDPPAVMTATLGCASCEGQRLSASALVGQADIALHVAKADPETSVCCYRPEMAERAHDRILIEARLKSALERNEFSAVYQPLVDAHTGRLTALEALIRWQPPGEDPIFPDRFIPVAEQSGLIVEVGNWMIERVCRQVAEWGDVLPADVRVAINVSMRQLRSESLVPTLSRALREHGVSATRLKIEITESAMMENVEDAAEQLAEVRRTGVEIAVDDFGTGFSSLSHLKRLPVSELKIDRSFVMDILTSEESRTIVRSVIRLGHELNMCIVAEGVEDAQTLAWLADTGCDVVQGYFFARPSSAADLRATGWFRNPSPQVAVKHPS